MIDIINQVSKWVVTAGQQPADPAPSARQTAFYTGMQLEELAEKLTAILGPGTLAEGIAWAGKLFKRGDFDAQTDKAMRERPAELLDADIDLLWVTVGGARAQGADVGGAAHAVCQANWAKFPEGVVTRDKDGKVMKPLGWTPPNLMPFVHVSLRPDPNTVPGDFA